MDDKQFDRFFVHLAQQNFEACTKFLDSASNSELVSALRHLVEFEVFYLSFNWLRYDDSNRYKILEVLEHRIRETGIRSVMFREMMTIVDIRSRLSNVYKTLGKDDPQPHTILPTLGHLVKTVKEVTESELSSYKEACLCELQSLQSCLNSSLSISHFDYFLTILNLTEAREQLRHWELLFIHKKYTPSYSNSKVEYNEVYKWHIQHFHNLLAKAAIYFYSELCDIVDSDVMEYGQELKKRYNSLRIEKSCTSLAVDCFLLVAVLDDHPTLLYSFQIFLREDVQSIIPNLFTAVPRDVVIQREAQGKSWLLIEVETGVYAGIRFDTRTDTDGLKDFFLSVVLRLMNVLPCV